MKISILYHLIVNSQLNRENLTRCYIKVFSFLCVYISLTMMARIQNSQLYFKTFKLKPFWLGLPFLVNLIRNLRCFLQCICRLLQISRKLSSIWIEGYEKILYNNYSETRNLIGQYPCRMRQSCTEKLTWPVEFTRFLWA